MTAFVAKMPIENVRATTQPAGSSTSDDTALVMEPAGSSLSGGAEPSTSEEPIKTTITEVCTHKTTYNTDTTAVNHCKTYTSQSAC